MSFKAVKKANKFMKMIMSQEAEKVAAENGWNFTGNIEPTKGSSYTAEFEVQGDYFYGWAIWNDQSEDVQIDFIFGSGQQTFEGYVTTEEDYFETIGAGV